jgi:hypothetical protein
VLGLTPMRFILLVFLSLFFSTAVTAYDVSVNGYTRKDGTYVQPYHRTSPDSNPYNNYSTRGNTNPYTGQTGTVNPNGSSSSGSGYNYNYNNNTNLNNNNPYGY